jgi:all-trans-retinol 13,14-reductase
VWAEAPEGAPPAMFVSFASLKDPSYDPGPESKHSGELLAWTDWSVVARWADRAPGERGEGYLAFKRQVEDAMFTQFRNYFPALADLVVFRDLSTPLATAAITGHNQGAFYGLEVTPRRMLSNALRMKTPVEGLYLAGQDALTPGIPGAMWGGLLCAGSIDPKVFSHLTT